MLSKKTFDIQVDYPVKLPASLPRLPHGVQRRLPGGSHKNPDGTPVYRGFQSRLHHHLRDPIRYGWNPQLSFPAIRLGIFTVRTGGGK